LGLLLSADDTTLDGSSSAYGLIGVDTGVGVLSVEEVLYYLSDLWDT